MVRVLIERRVSEGMLEAFHLALRRMRTEAVLKPGYISGESWRNARNPHHFVVISTWNSRPDWEAWFGSEGRRQEMLRVGPMLEEAERITVLEPV